MDNNNYMAVQLYSGVTAKHTLYKAITKKTDKLTARLLGGIERKELEERGKKRVRILVVQIIEEI